MFLVLQRGKKQIHCLFGKRMINWRWRRGRKKLPLNVLYLFMAKNLFRNKNSWVQKLSGFPFNFLFHSFSSFLSFQFWRIQRTKKSRTFFQGHFSIKFLAYSPSLEYLTSKAYIIWLHVKCILYIPPHVCAIKKLRLMKISHLF